MKFNERIEQLLNEGIRVNSKGDTLTKSQIKEKLLSYSKKYPVYTFIPNNGYKQYEYKITLGGSNSDFENETGMSGYWIPDKLLYETLFKKKADPILKKLKKMDFGKLKIKRLTPINEKTQLPMFSIAELFTNEGMIEEFIDVTKMPKADKEY